MDEGVWLRGYGCNEVGCEQWSVRRGVYGERCG